MIITILKAFQSDQFQYHKKSSQSLFTEKLLDQKKPGPSLNWYLILQVFRSSNLPNTFKTCFVIHIRHKFPI